ncbi:MAG: hypothetical protein RLZZ592_3034 [Pseudomonadota bacterium]|jgi:glycosyltransferase involved in cell wall biosynthesis
MTVPLVSILIPTYNRADLISATIQSALAQTYPALEVVVVDNASTDNTWKVVQTIAATDARVRPFRNAVNVGPVNNWLECARHAQGVYSKILWSDDLLHPNFLAATVPFLEDDDTGFVYTATRIFSDGRDDLQAPLEYARLPTGRYNSSDFIEGSLLGEPFPVSPGCAIFRTADLQKNLWGDIPNAIGSDFRKHAIGNDLLLFLLTAQDYRKFAVVREPLALFREHAGSISVRSGPGRLILHYDLVRAYFAQTYIKDRRLLTRLNTLLWWHQRQYGGGQYGIKSVRDFYPEAGFSDISLPFLAQRICKRSWSKFRRYMSVGNSW